MWEMGIPGAVRGVSVSVKEDEKIVAASVSGTLRRYPMKRFVLFLILCVALTSCAGSKCNLEEYNAAVEPLLEEWDDAVDIANQTPRVGLPNVIPELQDIRLRTEDLEIEECFEDAHSFLVKYMNYTIDAFIAFMGQEDDSVVSQKFSLAQTNFETYLIKLDQAVEGD